MHSKLKQFSNFSRAVTTTSTCFRPDQEWDLPALLQEPCEQGWLARGNGLSYNDSCLLQNGHIIDTSRLNHLLDFDAASGLAVCQAAATFADLLLLDENYIPPVLPGTLHATIAGGIAHDVHGKNNPHAGSLGHHIKWLEVQISGKDFFCDATKNEELFRTTISGLGLTGVIRRIGLQLRQSSRWIAKRSQKYDDLAKLLAVMQEEGLQQDYQVAWLDLLNEPRALLFYGNHTAAPSSNPTSQFQQRVLPKHPLPFVQRWLLKQFNKAYFHQAANNIELIPLWQFNNPLDALKNWNFLYGRKGLLQFQGVFPTANALVVLQNLHKIIREYQAIPALAVLKLFTQKGAGLLSFPQPGFTIAVDFKNDAAAHAAIKAINQLIIEVQGNIYLAKDLFLTKEQFKLMYPQYKTFQSLLSHYKSPMRSDLSRRLGIHHE
jgi:decaprenylphospho-beta-D-ribofuranose 2-oxidase